MSDEIKKILDMVSNGTITQDEGEQLIEAIYQKDEETKVTKKNKTLRVRVTSNEGDKEKATVNVNIPLVLAKKISGLTKLVPNQVKSDLTDQGIDLDSIDIKELIEMFESGEITEDLVDIDVEGENPAKVRVYVD
ncbi:MAG: hypothetical protein AB1Z23_05975 [Eubacteriales bacterium]